MPDMINLSQLGEGITPHIYEDMQAVASSAARLILQSASAAIAERGAFHLVLAGGGTPKLTYQRLIDADTDWSRWHIYFGDERCLPTDDPERNSIMAQRAWLDHVAIPQSQIYPIAAELGAAEGAAAYAIVIAKALPFDMVLLGMGEDGHTASLFPGHLHDESEWVHAIAHAPKPPTDRVSLSLKCLGRSRQMMLLVTGATKYAALAGWSTGARLPIALLRSEGEILLLVDRVAIEG